MAAAKPASPPPTIAILIPAAIALHDSWDQSSQLDKCNRRVDADREQKQSNRDACITGQALRSFADRDAPVNQEQPNAIGEMPNGRRNSDHVYDKDADVMKLARDDIETLIRMMRDRHGIQPRNHSKAEIQNVKGNEEEEYDPGDSLNRVEPISRVWIIKIVRPRFDRDHQPIHCVIN